MFNKVTLQINGSGNELGICIGIYKKYMFPTKTEKKQFLYLR